MVVLRAGRDCLWASRRWERVYARLGRRSGRQCDGANLSCPSVPRRVSSVRLSVTTFVGDNACTRLISLGSVSGMRRVGSCWNQSADRHEDRVCSYDWARETGQSKNDKATD